jgi:hypothetical protein
MTDQHGREPAALRDVDHLSLRHPAQHAEASVGRCKAHHDIERFLLHAAAQVDQREFVHRQRRRRLDRGAAIRIL